MKNKALKLLLLSAALLFSGCGNTGSSSEISETSFSQTSSELSNDITYENEVSIAQAIQLAQEAGETGTTIKYVIRGTVKSISNTTFGNMYVTDGTNEIQIYGSFSEDGSAKFDEMDIQPKVGDTIVIKGLLKTYNSSPEMVDGWILEIKSDSNNNTGGSSLPTSGEVSIAQAIEIALSAGNTQTTGVYIIKGTVKSVDNTTFGNMYITDGKDEILIYGTYDEEGNRYDSMSTKPLKGDEVVLEGHLMAFNGNTPQIKDATLKSISNTFDESTYASKTISEARTANEGSKIKVTGVVARITKANGFVNDGFYVVDKTNSIYVYGIDSAGSVQVGNTVTVCGTKEYYVIDSESSNAEKYGYGGCNQISNARVISNDGLTTGVWDTSWVEEKTVKEIMDTPVSEDITTSIFKVTALVKKVIPESNDFVNYYINDLDGYTGSYVYTKNNGNDYSYLDEFDGKICTVYLSVINAKSSSSGCLWRFVPIFIEEDTDYVFDMTTAPNFAWDYYLDGDISSTYTAGIDADVEVQTKVSNDILDFEANISYSSSNEEVVYFETEEDVTKLHTGIAGTSTITVEISVSGQKVLTKTIEVSVETKKQYDCISVEEAIAAEIGAEVQLQGIVVSSLVNQEGFYLQDETGIIAVTGSSADVSSLNIGDEVVIKGTRGEKHSKTNCSTPGQINVYNAELVDNFHGNNSYSSADFITGKTVSDLYNLKMDNNYTTSVYVVKGVYKIETTGSGSYQTKISKLYSEDGSVAISLYCSSAAQYSQFESIEGQVGTFEIAIINWNCKTYYTGCIISAQVDGGEKIINSLNFDK